MKHVYSLTVLDKSFETDDSVVLTLAASEADAGEFRYEQGQHLPLRAELDGKGVRRTYSICSSVDERTLRLGIRIQPHGTFSNYVADQLQIGDTIESLPPFGHFNTPLDASEEKNYVAFVAGSGITPLLSIVKTTLETEATSRFVVFYGNRKRSTTMFIEELMALKNTYGERLSLHFVMSREPTDISLYEGRIDGEKARALHLAFLSDLPVDDVFICGPNPMIDEITDVLIEAGYSKEKIHAERFRPNKGRLSARPEIARTPPDDEGKTEVTLVVDGNRETMYMREGELVLDAALRQGVGLPYSCRSGVCSTCRAKLTRGDVEMALTYALEPWELEQGYILTCQSKPKSDALEIDYDQI